jgi:hypothetical protein
MFAASVLMEIILFVRVLIARAMIIVMKVQINLLIFCYAISGVRKKGTKSKEGVYTV